jgi:hypothetical protein
MRIIINMDNADPNGQSWAARNWLLIMFPIISDFPPPRIAGVTNAPKDGMKTSIDPATTPGKDRGQMTREKTFRPGAYKSLAASNRLGSNRSNAAKIGRTISGSHP